MASFNVIPCCNTYGHAPAVLCFGHHSDVHDTRGSHDIHDRCLKCMYGGPGRIFPETPAYVSECKIRIVHPYVQKYLITRLFADACSGNEIAAAIYRKLKEPES